MPHAAMRLLRSFLATALTVLSVPAFATAQRTFVASNGVDTNPCSIALPCRGFAAAVAQTNAGGEVIVLDSAGYGAVSIAKSVSILAPAGVYAGISVSSGNGVTVNGAGIKVRLRGLQINGVGGATGIAFQQGTELAIEDCAITNMGDNGIDLRAPGSATYVSGSAIRSSVNSGIYADAFGGPVQVDVLRSRLEVNGWGLYVRQGARATLSESAVTGNSTGVFANNDNPGATQHSEVSIDTSTISHNTTAGIAVSNSVGFALAPIARVSHTGLRGNGTAAQVIGNDNGASLSFSEIDTDSDVALVGLAALGVSGSRLDSSVSCTSVGGSLPHVSSAGNNWGNLGLFPASCAPSLTPTY